MKVIHLLIVTVCCATPLRAEHYKFQIDRFCELVLTTDEGSEHITIKNHPKAVTETVTILDSKITLEKGVYTTGDGIFFELLKLSKPIINDKNRQIGSGQWVLLISGEGEAYNKLLMSIPGAPHPTESMQNPIYLGSEVEK